jgi:flagellar basal-body rod protein FlgC
MIQGLNAAVSGLQTAQIRSNVAAHDVANVNTPGFEERDVVQQAKPDNGGSEVVDIRKVPNDNPEFSNTDLAKETVEQISASYDFKANAAQIRAQDEMMGTLLDIKK